MDLPISGEARDEIARILEQVAKEGLDHPRDLDAAIDAIGTALQGEPIQKAVDAHSAFKEVYWIDEDADATEMFGSGVVVTKGYFVAVTE